MEKQKRPADYLAPHRSIFLMESDKLMAMAKLIELICTDAEIPLDRDSVFEMVWRREETLPTRVAPGIVIPHARIDEMDRSLVAAGISREGIIWDNQENEPVKLVILILGPENQHLQILSHLATRLSNEKLYKELLTADDSRTVYDLLALPYPGVVSEGSEVQNRFSVVCFEHALTMAREMEASTIVLHADAVGEIAFLEKYRLDEFKLIVIARDISRYPPCPQITRFLSVPIRGLNRSSQVNVAFLFLVSQGIVAREERVVSVCGTPESGILDTVMVTSANREYYHFFPEQNDKSMPADIEPQVLSRVLQVASNLAEEGREGKPVGTMFVVGDYSRVEERCRQMVINPFKGYSEEDRNILDPALEETIKEFSRIDGAFVLRGDGVIMSAGTYLRTDAQVGQLPSGLGARHAAAALVSRQTRALSVVLSESTRRVSLFRQGERILEL